MEIRKVQETGKGTLFTTLPKEWCKKYAITRGAILSLEIKEDGMLLIYPFKREEPASEITCFYEHDKPSEVTENIIGAYLLGYTLIEVISKNSLNAEEREKIRETISRLVGLEIIEETYDKMTIKFILDPSELSPDAIFSRMSFISENMIIDIGKALEQGLDKKILEGVSRRENELDRQYFLLIRLLRTTLVHPKLSIQYKISPIETMDRRMAAYFIETVGDLTANISEELSQTEAETLQHNDISNLRRILEDVIEIYDKSITAVLKRDRSRAKGVTIKYEEINRSLSQMAAEEKTLRDLADYALKVSKAAVDIADLASALYQPGTQIQS
ncbi:MAG: PhoU domain-containing protein [Nitrososphaeria archaeon]